MISPIIPSEELEETGAGGRPQRGMNSSTVSCSTRSVLVRSALLLGGAFVLVGCGSYPESNVVSAPPPPAPTQQVVVTQPQATAPQVATGTAVPTAGGTIVVMQAPPAAQQEVVVAQPSSDHVWVPGNWTWRNDRYEWRAGRWEIPPRTGSVWVAPRWERLADGSYRFTEGYWR